MTWQGWVEVAMALVAVVVVSAMMMRARHERRYRGRRRRSATAMWTCRECGDLAMWSWGMKDFVHADTGAPHDHVAFVSGVL